MKFLTALILASCLQVSARGYGQKITLDFKNAPIEKVFREIQRQSGYLFVYNDKVIGEAPLVTLKTSNATIEEVLNSCLKDSPLVYELKGKTIIIKEKPVTNITKIPITVSGKVITEENEPLQGATILIKGTNEGTMTDNKGEFVLRDISDDAILVISSVGYDQQETTVNNKTVITVKLKRAVKGLDETIVKGYYNESRRNSTGSVSKIGETELSAQPLANPLQALEGRVTGLYISQGTGLPGSNYKIMLRGKNSISGGANPLYIVDGLPFTAQSLSAPLLSAGTVS